MIANIRKLLQAKKCDSFISTNTISRRYLTNFTGSAGLVWIDQQHNILATDFRYTDQAEEQTSEWQLMKIKDTIANLLKQLVADNNVQRIAFESEYITVEQLHKWEQEFKVEFVPTKDWVFEMRIIKSKAEISKIKKAAEIADQALTTVMQMIEPGITELEVALELEFTMRKLGAEDISFDPIVGSGPRGALPHALPSEREFTHGDFIVIDMGCIYQGYCSDMTRTLLIGEPTDKHLEVYNLVLEAQLASLEAVKAGVRGVDVDKVARDIITEGGYGENFGHGLGHGVGLEIHEEPRLSPLSEKTLEPNMIVTVEPGIYLPGWGGVRIEDLVVVTDSGCDILSQTSKDLYIIA